MNPQREAVRSSYNYIAENTKSQKKTPCLQINMSNYHQRTPTVVPSAFFLSREDAETLWHSLQANKTDSDAIINILAKRTFRQRIEIMTEYKKLHGQDLKEDLKKKLGSDFENLIVALLTPLPEFYAEELNRAIRGPGTDESDLIEVLCTLNNREIKEIRRAYHQKYEKTLESDIKGDTSGYFRDLLVMLCNTERKETYFTSPQEAKSDAEALFNVKEKRWEIFSDVLCHRSYRQLRLIFKEYQTLDSNGIEKAIKDDFSGDVEEGLLAIVESVKNEPAFFAKQLYKSVKGLGTHDHDLIRLVVTRSEIDMGDIKKEYEAQYSKTLADAIKGDTSGDYKNCLLTLIGEL